MYNKFILICASNNENKTIRRKLLQSGSIIEHCHTNYVSDKGFCIDYIIKYYCYLCLFKMVHTNDMSLLSNILTYKSHNYNTRKANDFSLNRSKNTFCDKGFWYFAPRMWNALPLHQKIEMNFFKFKGGLNEFLAP